MPTIRKDPTEDKNRAYTVDNVIVTRVDLEVSWQRISMARAALRRAMPPSTEMAKERLEKDFIERMFRGDRQGAAWLVSFRKARRELDLAILELGRSIAPSVDEGFGSVADVRAAVNATGWRILKKKMLAAAGEFGARIGDLVGGTYVRLTALRPANTDMVSRIPRDYTNSMRQISAEIIAKAAELNGEYGKIALESLRRADRPRLSHSILK
jgi:hypothetical protein